MDFLATLVGWVWQYGIMFLLVLTLVVFVHELGHFLVARWCGVTVKAFSIGFGPEIYGFYDKYGTRWRFAWIPLGGYVKFIDDENAASFGSGKTLSPAERAGSFHGKSVGARAAVVAAGPIANFILAIFIFAVMFATMGKSVADPVVAELKPGSVAEAVGVKPGDVLIALDGRRIETFDEVVRYISMRPELPVKVTVRRAESEIDFDMVPRRAVIADSFGNEMEVGQIGIITNQSSGNFRVVELSPLQAVWEGFRQTGHIITGTFDYIGNMIAGRMNADQLGGPVRVVQASGEMATLGVIALLNLAAVLSVSLGLLNLMPVPVLDGGHLVLYAIEAVRGRPVGPGAQEIAFRIGLAMILSLMVFATWNDISRLIG